MDPLEHPWDKLSVQWGSLDPDEVVLEVGGYEGRWSLEMAKRYVSPLHIFEPQPWAAARCRERLKPFPNAHVHEYALGTFSGPGSLGSFGNDGCSLLKPDDMAARCDVWEFGSAMHGLGVQQVGLALINIEGYEFHLIPHLFKTGWIKRIRRLMVQFHEFADPDGSGYQSILQELAKTHSILWDFGRTLTAWEQLA